MTELIKTIKGINNKVDYPLSNRVNLNLSKEQVDEIIFNLEKVKDLEKRIEKEKERVKELEVAKGFKNGYSKANEWNYNEPTESENNFYVILKNGNHRICYWDLISKADKCLKNVINGEHIAFDFIRCWKEIELPKEM